MKRFIAFLIALTIILSISACSDNINNDESISTGDFDVKTDIPAADVTAELSEDSNLSALELVGYYTDSEGNVCLNYENWQQSDDFDLFRKYFFGAWENAEAVYGAAAGFRDKFPLFIIDDSEKAFIMNEKIWNFTGFYKLSDNVLTFLLSGNAETKLFWMDINDTDTLYVKTVYGYKAGVYGLSDCAFDFLTKTDAEPNKPEDNFLSIYKLYEMSQDYGIDFNMLVYIECENEAGTQTLLHDTQYQFYPVYIVSESTDKLEFKTQIGNLLFENSEMDIGYTVEKIDGEWTRTVTFY